MQTAVDCNGSSSSNNSNNSIITTTTTTTTTTLESSNDVEPHHASGTTTVIGRSPIAMLEQQPTNVLRHRLQAGMVRTASANVASFTQNNGTAHQLVDAIAVEYAGSNVERISITPTPTPHASPAKSAGTCGDTTAIATISAATVTPKIDFVSGAKTGNTSSSSSSSSSTTSSVIASPVQATRNGNVFPAVANAAAVSTAAAVAATTEKSKRREVLATKGLPLASHTATSAVCVKAEKEHSNTLAVRSSCGDGTITEVPTTPLQLSWSSSNSHSPATTTTSASVSAVSSISSTPLTTPAKTPSATMEAQLLQWHDMPQYLQFNPYVLKGYRPLQTFKGCLLSLFYWHNETINILTHAIPIVYILAIVPGLMPWEQEYRFLSFCHVFGSVAPWCGSFVYHLFMNIEKGENVYYRLLKLDMVGIWVSQSFGALPLVTATTFCFSYKWKWLIIVAYSLLSLWGLYKALTASSPWQRRLCFALPFTMRSILTLLRTMGLVGGNPIALSHVYLQDGVSILGGAIGAMRIPEKWFPGVVDFYLNSHNIMHVLVVVAVYSMHKATIKDFEWMSATNCTVLANTGEAIESGLNSDVEL